MPDPFVHQSSDDLKASTAITRVGDEAMSHAAEDAMRQVAGAVSLKSKKGGKKPKFAAAVSHPTEQSVPTMNESPAEVERSGDLETASALMPEDGAERIDAPAATMTAASEPALELPPFHDDDVIPASNDIFVDVPPHVASTPIPETISDDGALQSAEATATLPGGDDVLTELTLKVTQVLQLNIDLSVAFWTSITQAKTPADVVKAHASHLHHQIERFMSQSLELSALARKASAMSITSLVGTFDRFKP